MGEKIESEPRHDESDPDPKNPENKWMFLPPGIPSLEDPATEALKQILGFYYKVHEFQAFRDALAEGRTIEELIEENPLLKVKLDEWRGLGLIE